MAVFRKKHKRNAPTLGIYVHIPFCVRKCDYCDFYSVVGRDSRMNGYLRALEKHMEEYAAQASSYLVDSIYFGGGTPTFFGADRLGRLLQVLRKQFCISQDCEITVECNPDSADQETLRKLRKSGVNRLSMGVQSAQDSELLEIGRVHNYAQASRAFRRARDAGFDNLSLDLIYGLPGQTMESWKDTVEKVLQLNPEHLSCYGLKLEEGTPLYQRQAQEEMADDDTQADMYLWMVQRLSDAGYAQYEISNFSRINRRSRHNLKYWMGQEYLGFGPAAHSYFGGQRFSYVRDLDLYVEGILHNGPILAENNRISRKESGREYIMLRMRTVQGMEGAEYKDRFYQDFEPLEKRFLEYEGYGWAEKTNGRWHFTPSGFLLSNPLIGDLLAIQEEQARETMRPILEKRTEAEGQRLKMHAMGRPIKRK